MDLIPIHSLKKYLEDICNYFNENKQDFISINAEIIIKIQIPNLK